VVVGSNSNMVKERKNFEMREEGGGFLSSTTTYT
jgi:hypothetical protein